MDQSHSKEPAMSMDVRRRASIPQQPSQLGANTPVQQQTPANQVSTASPKSPATSLADTQTQAKTPSTQQPQDQLQNLGQRQLASSGGLERSRPTQQVGQSASTGQTTSPS